MSLSSLSISLRDQAFGSTMIMEEVPLYLSLDEASQALLHQCGIISMFTEKATPAADPITSLVEVCRKSDD